MSFSRTLIPCLAVLLAVACTQLPPDEGPQPFDASDRTLEREIALKAQDTIRAQLRPHPDPMVQAYVRNIGRKIVSVSDRRDISWQFVVIDDDQMNAFTIGDGQVYVYSGLLAKLENEAQVASVIGHEAAHVTRFHTVVTARKAQETQLIVGAAGAALGGSDLAGLASGVAGSIIQNGFSRDQEDQADRVGMLYTQRAGYDVREFPRVFEIFGREGGERSQLFNDLFGSHSTPAERVADTRRILAERYGGGSMGGRLGAAEHRAIQARLR